mgnify:FL=1
MPGRQWVDLEQDPLYLEADAETQREMELEQEEYELELQLEYLEGRTLLEDGVDTDEPIGYDEQYDIDDEGEDYK